MPVVPSRTPVTKMYVTLPRTETGGKPIKQSVRHRTYTEKAMLAVAIHDAVHALHPPAAFNLAERIIESTSPEELCDLLNRNDSPSDRKYRKCPLKLSAETCSLRPRGFECRNWHRLCEKILEARLWYTSRLRDCNIRDVRISWVVKKGHERLVWVKSGEWVTMAQAVSVYHDITSRLPQMSGQEERVRKTSRHLDA